MLFCLNYKLLMLMMQTCHSFRTKSTFMDFTNVFYKGTLSVGIEHMKFLLLAPYSTVLSSRSKGIIPFYRDFYL